jgi:hypothetical protein
MKLSSPQSTSRYLRAADLDGPRTATVTKVTMEYVGGRTKTEKPVLYVREFAQGVPLNPSSRRNLIESLGDETDTWLDQQIIVAPDEFVADDGRTVQYLRVYVDGEHVQKRSPPPPKTKTARAALKKDDSLDDLNDEIPF